jgi:hypothetical protein
MPVSTSCVMLEPAGAVLVRIDNPTAGNVSGREAGVISENSNASTDGLNIACRLSPLLIREQSRLGLARL